MRKTFLKNTLYSIAFLATTMGYSQEAGSIGTLLRNEAKASDINSVRIQVDVQGGAQRKPNLGDYRTPPSQYTWNPAPYGYSEVFLRIADRGYFTVVLGDQQISSPSGKFRFFDVRSGALPLSIYLNGFLVYQTTLRTAENQRSVLDYFVQYGLYELERYPIEKGWYGGEWNDIWNNPYRAGRQLSSAPHIAVMPEEVFANFFAAYKRLTFDNERIGFIRQQQNTAYTAAQIKQLLARFDFDNNKVDMGKTLFPLCADRGNFFIVYDIFTYDSYKRQLMDFVASYRQ